MHRLLTKGLLSRRFVVAYCERLLMAAKWNSFAQIMHDVEDKAFYPYPIPSNNFYFVYNSQENVDLEVDMVEVYSDIIVTNYSAMWNLISTVPKEFDKVRLIAVLNNSINLHL
jgi:hypothetical protein